MQQITVNVLMVDGTEHRDVKIILADQVAFSTTRQRHKWPTMEDDPVLFGSFVAFSSLKRTGAFTGTWTEFTEQCAQVEAVENEEPEVF
ncbi:hypothetical protein [Corynebacterium senegalense]|uniref:hypothetical protein n=1 Tax=Corynebacterium senegalense TaxID=2080750 RepID=UPI000E201C6F|nr:hypothetical protein [Corynebacterium senegalense]